MVATSSELESHLARRCREAVVSITCFGNGARLHRERGTGRGRETAKVFSVTSTYLTLALIWVALVYVLFTRLGVRLDSTHTQKASKQAGLETSAYPRKGDT